MVRRRYSRKKYKPKYTTVGSVKHLASQAWKGVKFLKSVVNAEKHFHDTSLSGQTTNAGAVFLLNQIAAGDDAINRTGNSIKLIDLYMHLNIEQAAAESKNFVRVVICQDTANQSAVPSVTDILQSASATSMINFDNAKRFKILYSKVIGLSYPDKAVISLNAYRRLGFHIKFSGTADTTYLQNSLFILLIDENNTNHADYSGTIRIKWYDN